MNVSVGLRDAVAVSTTTTASPELAFEVFTARIEQWWNPEHHVLSGTQKAMHVEPYVGGRLWDENTEGETCTWGRVLTWEPGQVFAFSWLIGTDWAPPLPGAPGSRVTVTFTGIEGGGTRVDLVHDQIAVHGPGWEGLREGVGGPGGWPAGLALYVACADQALPAPGLDEGMGR